jgi:asparagine N-glycosylation enzyme membrane subunit Stt3
MIPFAVFGIILWCGILLVRLLPLFGKLDPGNRTKILYIFLVVAAVAGLVSSLISLRQRLQGSMADRIIYFLIAGVFMVLAVCFGIFLHY